MGTKQGEGGNLWALTFINEFPPKGVMRITITLSGSMNQLIGKKNETHHVLP